MGNGNGNYRPTRKISAAALGGAFSVIIVWIVTVAFSVDVPGTVGTAIGTLASAFVGYMVPESSA